MSLAAQDPRLAAECRVFCRYLTREEPSDYVLGHYARARASAEAPAAAPVLDRGLLALARRGPLLTRVADGYSRIFQPHSTLRRRLILLLAILENSPPSARSLNSAREGRPLALLGRLALTMLGSAACLLTGVLLLGPLHLASRLPRAR